MIEYIPDTDQGPVSRGQLVTELRKRPPNEIVTIKDLNTLMKDAYESEVLSDYKTLLSYFDDSKLAKGIAAYKSVTMLQRYRRLAEISAVIVIDVHAIRALIAHQPIVFFSEVVAIATWFKEVYCFMRALEMSGISSDRISMGKLMMEESGFVTNDVSYVIQELPDAIARNSGDFMGNGSVSKGLLCDTQIVLESVRDCIFPSESALYKGSKYPVSDAVNNNPTRLASIFSSAASPYGVLSNTGDAMEHVFCPSNVQKCIWGTGWGIEGEELSASTLTAKKKDNSAQLHFAHTHVNNFDDFVTHVLCTKAGVKEIL